jgi:hypothetical protein
MAAACSASSSCDPRPCCRDRPVHAPASSTGPCAADGSFRRSGDQERHAGRRKYRFLESGSPGPSRRWTLADARGHRCRRLGVQRSASRSAHVRGRRWSFGSHRGRYAVQRSSRTWGRRRRAGYAWDRFGAPPWPRRSGSLERRRPAARGSGGSIAACFAYTSISVGPCSCLDRAIRTSRGSEHDGRCCQARARRQLGNGLPRATLCCRVGSGQGAGLRTAAGKLERAPACGSRERRTTRRRCGARAARFRRDRAALSEERTSSGCRVPGRAPVREPG